MKDKEHYLTWEQIKALHMAGFEVGNHTKAHKAVSGQKPADIAADLEHIEKRCIENGIPVPTTFSYPGYATSPAATVTARITANTAIASRGLKMSQQMNPTARAIAKPVR